MPFDDSARHSNKYHLHSQNKIHILLIVVNREGIPTMIKFTPRFNGPIQGRAVNIIKRFYPYLCAEHEFDDLMQEAWLVFARCKHLYGTTVDNPRWFMVLFGRALTNKLINLSKKCGRYISIEALDNFEEPATEVDMAFANRLIRELPEEVHQLMAAVVSGTVADGRLAFAQIRRKHQDIKSLGKE